MKETALEKPRVVWNLSTCTVYSRGTHGGSSGGGGGGAVTTTS